MSNLGAILCSGLLPGLGIEPCERDGFRGWLDRETYVPTTLENNIGIMLDRIELDAFVKAINYDFERFALSSKETYAISLSEQESFKVIGWPLLKLYYAAFFSAHAIMRSRGYGVVRLERPHLRRLREIAEVYGENTNVLSPGNYLFNTNMMNESNNREIQMVLTPINNNKGVHESFWINFCNFLDCEARRAITQQTPRSQEFLSEITALKDSIMRNDSVWLSNLRNQINYQHSHDTWLPYKKSSESYKSMKSYASNKGRDIRSNNIETREPIRAFIYTTIDIIEISIEIGNYVAKRSTKGNAFGQKWRRISEITS